MYENLIKIYKLMIDKNYHTAKELSNHINISDRTCRKLIKELKDILNSKNIDIVSKEGCGYKLEGNLLKETEIFDNLKTNKLPNNTDERCDYILEKLVNTSKYVKLEDISKELYISTKTISLDIKKIDIKVRKYNLKIERKPYYGIKIVGSELDIRNLLVDILEKKLNENTAYKDLVDFEINEKTKQIYSFLKENMIKISDISFQNLISAMFITLKRTKENRKISKIDIDKNNLFLDKRKLIVECMQKVFGNVKLDDNDLDYITIRFLTTETLKYQNTENIKEINELINEILYYIKLTFKIDLYDDEELYKNLYTHLLALTIRLRFDIRITNPLLDEIKINMPLEYNISFYISKILGDRYNKKLTEHEIGYISVILHMSIGFKKQESKKKNILIVCPSGRGVSKFLIYTYSNLFSEYSNLISSCGVNELLDINLDTIDVIFSLVDIEFKLDKPIYKINYFLKDDEIMKIKNILMDDKSYIKNLMPRDLFTYIDSKITKEKVINIMSNKLKKIKYIPDNIEQLLLKREKLGMTEISKQIAIPHSVEVIPNINLIGVCILKHAVTWLDNKVNLVLFMLLDNKNNENEMIYKTITKLIDEKELIQNIIKNPNYDYFVSILEEFYKKGEKTHEL
ncbi:BglG family transcription antiterminator [Oceanivirga salmonicida]|uniref:BglG family transcription antiterminator n=1 Tax=Oceanivirga salmonicida TaxID=1769291 RepID=UPI0012E114C0|nr:BglG family transcription antiterminator [Oceanivirga salmonicida]